MWKNFNVENDTDWQSTVLDAKAKGLLSVELKATPKPTPTVPAPSNLGVAKTITVSGGSNWNLRTEPDVMKGAVVGMVRVGEVINLYTTSVHPNGGNNFYYVERITPTAGESASGWLAYVLPSTAPLPPQPPQTQPAPSVPYPEVSAFYARDMAKVYHSLATSQRLMADDSDKVADQWAKLADVIEGKAA